MIDGLETGEHTALGDALEMIFANVEHGGAQIEFVEELRDENVHLQNVGHVLALHVPQHVDEPLKVTVGRASPQKVDFLASYARVPVGGCTEHQVVEDGGVGRDADASAHHDGHFEFVPVLISATEGAIQLDLGVHDVRIEIAGIKVVAQLPSPRPLSLDMARQEVFMRRGCQRERVEFLGLDLRARKADPLAGKVLEVGRTVELDLEHVRRQQLRLDDVQFHELGAQADDLVQSEDDGRSDVEDPEARSGRQTTQSVDDAQNVQENVQRVGQPEEVEGLLADGRMGEDEDDDHDDEEADASESGQRLEQPVGDGRLEVGRETQFFGQAAQMFHRLRRHVVEVDHVTDGMQHGEEEGGQSANLVEGNVRIQRNVLLDGKFLEFGQEVARHGQQEEGVVEGEGGSRSASDGDAHAHNVSQVRVLRHERVMNEALDEQGDGDDVEDEQVENVLAVAFQESDDAVPATEERIAVPFLDSVDVETCHAGHVGRSVQEILFGSFAVQSDGDEVAAIFSHHQLEVVVGQRVFVMQSGGLEHSVDQFRHLVVVQTVVGAGDFDQRAQHFRQFDLVDDSVPVVVAHVENDAQLVFRFSLGEEDDRVQKLLERNAAVAVLVDDVEHHFDEDVVAFHAQRVGEFVARK